jgi:hypothetical protein
MIRQATFTESKPASCLILRRGLPDATGELFLSSVIIPTRLRLKTSNKYPTTVSLKPIFAFLDVDLREYVAVKFVGLEEKELFYNLDIAGFLIVPKILEFCRSKSNICP